jgi:serine/threonine protein kinase
MPSTRPRRVVKQQRYRIDDDDDEDDDDDTKNNNDDVQVEAPQKYGGILADLDSNRNANANNYSYSTDSESNHEKNHTTPVKSSKTLLRGSRRSNRRPRKSESDWSDDGGDDDGDDDDDDDGDDAGGDADSTPRENKKKPTPKQKNKNGLTPPPKSVVIGTLPCFSPPTHHPSQQQKHQQQQQQHYGDDLPEHGHEHENHSHNDDGVSALSCFASPPIRKQPSKSRQQQKQQVPVHRSDDMRMSGRRDSYSADCEPSDVGSVSSGGSNSNSNSNSDEDGETDHGESESEAEKTVPMAGTGDAQDPDETFLEEHSLEEQEQEQQQQQVEDDQEENSDESNDGDDDDEEDGDDDEALSDPEDDDDITSASEEEMDDDEDEEEEYTPDDDEFVPEDDEDLSTQDELEDVVEEKPLTRRGRQRKQASPPKPTKAKAKTNNKKVPAKKGQQKQPDSPVLDHEMSMAAQSSKSKQASPPKPKTDAKKAPAKKAPKKQPVSPVSDHEMSMEAQSPMDQTIDMDTEDEETPMLKRRNSRKASVEEDKRQETPVAVNRSLAKSFNASSPESLVAVVCDDDDEDDVDILEATILDDEAYSVVSAKSPESTDMPREASGNDEEEENENDDDDASILDDEDDQYQSYEEDEETVAFRGDLDLDEECDTESNPGDVSTNLDDEPFQEIEPVDEAVNDTAMLFAAVNLDNEPVEESEPVDVSASVDLDSEPVKETEESEPVDVSANLDTEPVNETEECEIGEVASNIDNQAGVDNESVDAAKDKTVPKFVSVKMCNQAANESEPVDVLAEEIGYESTDAPVEEDERLWEGSEPKLNLEELADVEESKSNESADDAVSENNENMVANLQDGSRQNVEKGTPTKSTPKETKSKQKKSYHRHEGIVKRGKWTLGAKIGVGSFGVVHIGMDTTNGTLMAVKTFQMERAVMKDVRREIELLRSLKHKNIVRYYGAEMDKKHLHIFQEWVPAGSVSTMLSRFGSFAMPVIRSYLSQTLSGLVYLHENHILHRDIKGSNLLVNDEGVVKLSDFGASKRFSNLQADLMMSMTVRGTPYFMAPEVFEEKYSSKADIWGVGCVAYQMTTGSPPWKGQGLSNPISLFNYIKRQSGAPSMTYAGDDELLSEGEKHVRTLFEAFVEKCYHKDPSKRPTARALLEDPFFTELHHGLDDDNQTPCRGIFSPCSDTSTRDGSTSPNAAFSPPFLGSPSPTKHSQSRSVVQWKQSFRSPPQPKRNNIIGSPSPMRASSMRVSPMRTARSPLPRSPYRPPSASKGSPSTDTSDWPTWARERHIALKKQQSTSQGTEQISELLDSLAMSEDSKSSYGPNPFRRSSATNGKTADESTMFSNLDGLKLLDQSDITYEI